jgi:hypothetical protein
MLRALTVLCTSAHAHGGVQLEVFNNTAYAGPATSASSNSSSLSAHWAGARGVLSAVWSGSLTPAATGSYRFNCSFANGVGLAWVDGHVLCTHGMPLYGRDVGPGALPLVGGQRYAVRMHFLKNTTAEADAGAELLWSAAPPAAGAAAASPSPPPPFVPVPTAQLSPDAPSASAQRMQDMQLDQFERSAGWGSWYPHNLLAVSRLPDGAQVVFGLCQLSTGACQLESVASSFDLRLGPHATDGSYAQLWTWWGGAEWDGGVNVSVTWGTAAPPPAPPPRGAAALADLRLTVGGASCGNCSNYALVLLPQFSPVWGRTGAVSVDAAAATLTIDPDGALPPTVLRASGPALGAGVAVNVSAPHLSFALRPGAPPVVLSSVRAEAPAATVAVLRAAEAAERARYTAYGSAALAELKEAVQASVMWLLVYVPYATGLVLTLSRGSMGGGNSQCDWDNFFAAMMLGSDGSAGKELGFAAFAQELGSRTVDGFVPNGANAASKSRDRTEPVVGAKVLRAFVRRFGIGDTAWLVEWSFDQLFGWHDWAWRERRLAPLGLIAPGSSPIAPLVDPSDWGVNTMQGARWESGMDNSPMYDGPDGSSDNSSGPVVFDAADHLMQLYDVGMSAGLASDMLALAEVGDAWCGGEGSGGEGEGGSGGGAGVGACGASVRAKIALLRERAAVLTNLTQAHLWDEGRGAFVNKLPARSYNASADAFYGRLSPTSFYPLMTGAPTAAQAERLATEHLLAPTGFCVTPADAWPPRAPAAAKNAVMLQSWRLQPAQQGEQGEVALCVAGAGAGAGASASAVDAPASCAALQKVGASLVRNESLAWSSAHSATAARDGTAAASRVPLFAFRPSSEANGTVVLGRAGDFPSAQRVSTTPAVYVASSLPQPGAWPLLLWRATRAPSAQATPAVATTAAAPAPAPAPAAAVVAAPPVSEFWRVTGGPGSDQETEQQQDSDGKIWKLHATLGWALPLPSACYWGLPSVSFDDPAFGSPGAFVYWRGNAWAPLAMLTYWGLEHEAYASVAPVQVARAGLANAYAKMWMETAWRPSRQVCENFCVNEQGGCCGDSFYHWGALAGFMSILEAGK